MENLSDVNSMINTLKQIGLDPNILGPEKLEKLMKFAENVKDPTNITPDLSRQLFEILGMSTKGTRIPFEQKVKPNDQCPCGKKSKYKKCCGKK
jgi:uncharacterized protein YecA (UPF0149 family)